MALAPHRLKALSSAWVRYAAGPRPAQSESNKAGTFDSLFATGILL